MKILHVFYSGLGGHGSIFFSMVNASRKEEFVYEALFYGIEEVKSEYIEQCAQQNITWYFVKKNKLLDPKFYLDIFRFIRRSKPAIIFLHGSSYIMQAKLAEMLSGNKSRIIVRETQANHLKTKAQWIALSLSMIFADKIVCLTSEFRDQVKNKLKFLYNSKKVTVISNGINLEIFKPAPKKERTVIIIGMQSRLVSIKDHLTLLKSFSLLKKESFASYLLKLKIAGDGDYKETLLSYTRELGLEKDVEFTGMISETELVTFLQDLDIYVHASLGETMSTAIMQAMACRLPVIASDVNGINNMITDNKTGLLVPPKNEVALASAFKKCIMDNKLRNSLAENAYDYARENFSNQKMMESYKKLFNSTSI